MADQNLANIISVAITRETQAIAKANFGVIGIISEFDTSKTTPVFDRWRSYASLTEMSDEGWTSSDEAYKYAQLVFSQNPVVENVIIGRKATTDTDWGNAITNIHSENPNFYGVICDFKKSLKIVLSADLVSLNSVAININSTPVTPVVFTVDHDTTMAAIITQIESDVTGSSAYLDPDDATNRTLVVDIFGTDITTATCVVTLGASQATATITYTTDYNILSAAATVETMTKIMGVWSNAAAIYDASSTTDIAYVLKALGYDRTFLFYHTDTDGDHINSAMMGEAFPYDPGSQTWAFKTLSGVAAYDLTSGELTAILNKNCNIYVNYAGVSITRDGKMVSGEFIDVMRGVDWLQSNIQEKIFAELVNVRKIPYTDAGVQVVVGLLNEALQDGVDNDFLAEGSIGIDYPLVSEVDTTDRANRLLPDIEFTATLAGAIHSVQISGIVSV